MKGMDYILSYLEIKLLYMIICKLAPPSGYDVQVSALKWL